jgi:hypothetical protein
LLALLGGIAGIGLAALGISAFRAMAPAGTPRLEEIRVDWTLLWFAIGSSLVAGLVFGLLPSRHASRIAPVEILKEGNAGSFGGFSKFGNALVVVEVALAFVLLAGATLMVQTLAHLLRQDPGFRIEHTLTFDLPQQQPPPQKNEDSVTDEQIARITEISETVRRIPGVKEVAAADHGVLSGMRFMHSGVELEEAPADKSVLQGDVIEQMVSPTISECLAFV